MGQDSVVTSTGASATAGIPNRMAPCLALRLYPGLQIPVPFTIYRRSPPRPRQVLPQQAIFSQYLGIKIEKTEGWGGGGIRPGILLSSLFSLFKDLDRPRSTRLLVLFPVSGGWEPGLRLMNNDSVGAQMWLSSQTSLFHLSSQGLTTYHLLLRYNCFRWCLS